MFRINKRNASTRTSGWQHRAPWPEFGEGMMHLAALPGRMDDQSEKRHREPGGSRPSIHPQHPQGPGALRHRAPGSPRWRGWHRPVLVQKGSWETCFLPAGLGAELGGARVCRTSMEPLSCVQGHSIPHIPLSTGESRGAPRPAFQGSAAGQRSPGADELPQLISLIRCRVYSVQTGHGLWEAGRGAGRPPR